MREIKFRGSLQYTGLKDDDGVEIYESDKLETGDQYHPVVEVVFGEYQDAEMYDVDSHLGWHGKGFTTLPDIVAKGCKVVALGILFVP